jgi:IS4 transposase
MNFVIVRLVFGELQKSYNLDEIQNIINLVESLDADSLSSVPSTISTATDEEQTYLTSTHLSFAQMRVNQVISSNIQSSKSSFASFAPSTSEIISSTVIDSDKTLVDTTITPTSILLNNPQVIQEKEHKKRGRKPMTGEQKRESKRQRDENKKK